jgi:Domain of unknown function (DUF1995)
MAYELCTCLQPFPADYAQALRQAQTSVQAAIQDNAKLIEVEFPTSTLSSVQGEAW